jgi:site-specific DNA recombinase
MLAAVYARSTKDRTGVSIPAQNHALNELAQNKSLKIVARYEDEVQKGSTDERPAFQRLIADIKRRDRGWSHLLMYDTSRLARGRYIAQVFKHQCKKYGVEILYAKLPETDPISAVILEAVFEAMDEVHSLMSRDKALAGMAENVRRGFRAGGRAPWGYDLKHEATGAIRDGKPVQKSKLVPNADADAARAYLTARAAGTSRARAARDLGVTLSATSLIGVEWNALTYAGITVWNRHADKKQRGNGQAKRRDRSEWQITEGTHEALITRAQAEAILTQLETSTVGQAVSNARRAMSGYLLSEVLYAPDGRRWIGAGKYYRLRGVNGERGKWIPAAAVERAVLTAARADFRSPKFIESLLKAIRAQAAAGDELAPIRAEIAKLEKQKAKAAMLALDEGGETFARLIPELSRKIEALHREASAVTAERTVDRSIRELTAGQLKETLIALDDDRAVAAALQRVILDPASTAIQVTYRLSVASPRGFEPLLPP